MSDYDDDDLPEPHIIGGEELQRAMDGVTGADQWRLRIATINAAWLQQTDALQAKLDALDAQVSELLVEHQPEWASEQAKANGRDPIGCSMCFPHDGSWPCVSRMIADDMHHTLHPNTNKE